MFNHKRTVGFEYAKEKGLWRLVSVLSDDEVVAVIGRDVLWESPVVPAPQCPQYLHLRNLLLALASHKPKLDGGSIYEEEIGDRYLVRVDVKPRQEKPQHQERNW